MVWLVSVTAGVAVIGVTALITVLRRRFAVITVDGPSMLPALSPGDRVLVRRVGLPDVRSGEVVVVEKPDGSQWPLPPAGRVSGRQWLIKRAAAVPSEPVPAAVLAHWPTAGEIVPAGKLVVLGDNSRGSYDSRAIGYIPAERLLGVVARRITAAQQSQLR